MKTKELHDLDGNIIEEKLSLGDKISSSSSNLLSSWKNLPKQNKMSAAYLVLFVLIMPITIWAVGQQLNIFPKAAPLTIPYLTPTPTPNQTLGSGPFNLYLSNSTTSINCVINDPNCIYKTDIVAINKLNQNLYNTTIYTSGGNVRYIDFNGNWTSGTSTDNKTILAGTNAANTKIEIKPFYSNLGKQLHTLFIDAKTCNLQTTPPDCYYYGASKLTVEINVVSVSPITPTSTPTPTMTRPLPGNCPKACKPACGISSQCTCGKCIPIGPNL